MQEILRYVKVSRIDNKTVDGVEHIGSLIIPSGFCILSGDVSSTPLVPKKLFVVSEAELKGFLDDAISRQAFPDTPTFRPSKLQEKLYSDPIDPNFIFIDFVHSKRREHTIISPGEPLKNDEGLGRNDAL